MEGRMFNTILAFHSSINAILLVGEKKFNVEKMVASLRSFLLPDLRFNYSLA